MSAYPVERNDLLVGGQNYNTIHMKTTISQPGRSTRPSSTGWSCIKGLLVSIQGICLVISLALIGTGIWGVSQREIKLFSNNVPIAVIVIGCFLLACAGLGLWAAYSEHRLLISVSGIFSTALVAVFIIISIVAVVLSGRVGDDKYMGTIQKNYHRFTIDDPKDLCDLQTTLKCSGFSGNTSCAFYYPTNTTVPDFGALCPTYNSSNPACFCPKNCDAVNQKFEETCYDKLRDEIESNFDAIAASLFTFDGLLFIAWVFNWVMCFRQRRDMSRPERLQ